MCPLEPLTCGMADLFQWKSVRTSAPLLPQACTRSAVPDQRADLIRPLVRAIAIEWLTMIVRAINQEIAHAGGAHFSEGELCRGREKGPPQLAASLLSRQSLSFSIAFVANGRRRRPMPLPQGEGRTVAAVL